MTKILVFILVIICTIGRWNGIHAFKFTKKHLFVNFHSLDGNRVKLRLTSDFTRLPENKLTIDEIKSELELRNIDYRDCISRKELVERLVEARATGKADPSIIDRFNEEISGKTIDASQMKDENYDEIQAEDGSLPGGLDAAAIKALVGNPKVVQLLKDPKMQEMMRTVMTGGQEAFKKRFMADPGEIAFLI